MAELRALRAEIAALRGAIEGASRRPLSEADAARLRVLLPAIDTACGDAGWALADVAALALVPGHADLAHAIAPHLRGGLRRLGKLLARGAGQDVDGFRLLQIGTDRAGALWQVVRVSRVSCEF